VVSTITGTPPLTHTTPIVWTLTFLRCDNVTWVTKKNFRSRTRSKLMSTPRRKIDGRTYGGDSAAAIILLPASPRIDDTDDRGQQCNSSTVTATTALFPLSHQRRRRTRTKTRNRVLYYFHHCEQPTMGDSVGVGVGNRKDVGRVGMEGTLQQSHPVFICSFNNQCCGKELLLLLLLLLHVLLLLLLLLIHPLPSNHHGQEEVEVQVV